MDRSNRALGSYYSSLIPQEKYNIDGSDNIPSRMWMWFDRWEPKASAVCIETIC